MTSFRLALLSVLALFLTVSPTVAQSGQDGEALLQSVQNRYNDLASMQADFTQTVTSDFSSDSTQVSGQLFLKGNKYRVETSEQTLVTDGTTSWVYTPADSQVVVNDAAQDPGALSPETFFTNYAERYRVTGSRTARRSGADHTVLSLAPKSDATTFESVTLWVRTSDRVITRLRVTDRNGSTIRIDLEAVTLNPSLADNRFRFDPPSHVDVVDLRSSE